MGFLILLAAVAGISYGIAAAAKESLHNRAVRKELGEQERQLTSRQEWLKQLEETFNASFLKGRKWLAAMIAEASAAHDSASETFLRTKKHPAPAAADVVREVRAEKRLLSERVKLLEYQLRSYEEYFPFLEEYREVILDERVPLGAKQNALGDLEDADPVLKHLTKEEYAALPEDERNQLALDRYIQRHKSDWEIGLLYERYLGHLRETAGWRVIFYGALKGYEDFGRDLICTKHGAVEIVQAKCWSVHKVIHEKHIFQLFATTLHYGLDNPFTTPIPVFVTTTGLSPVAEAVAARLKVRVERVALPRQWPMIKCNVNPSTDERIYHLPFDQQYDRAVIGSVPGEFYAATVQEARSQGFRRAFRYRGTH